MTQAAPFFAAILLDCDGVVADSEPVINRVVAADLTDRGWALTPDEAGENFLGLALPAMRPLIEARVGKLPDDWEVYLQGRAAETMAREVTPVEGAGALLERLRQAGLPLALCSNSSRLELEAKLTRLGFTDLFGSRIFSFEDVEKPKPAPDIYLAAAKACGVAPTHCAVIEDSGPGAQAGAAAGCKVFGFAQVTAARVLKEAGATETFSAHADLPRLLGLAELA